MSVVFKNTSDSTCEETRVGGGGSSCSPLRFDSHWIRGRVDSQGTKSGITICEECVEDGGHTEEASEGTCDEEVRGESYEETKLSDVVATEGDTLS